MTSSVIRLADIKSGFDGFARLADFASKVENMASETAEIDFARVSWFDANMSAPLAVIFAHMETNFNTVVPFGFQPKVQTILTKNQFLARFGYAPETDSHRTTIPYRRFEAGDGGYFAAYINEHLVGRGIPTMSESLGRRFKDSLFEIFVNSAMHSETSVGILACGQFFPMQRRLDFCLADGGMGIRKKIGRELGRKMRSDESIRWALQEGNTTRRGSVPGGLGLKLLREFVALNRGRLQIVSDRGYWELADGLETLRRLEHSFPGTVVNLEINTADTRSYRLTSENRTESTL